MKLPMIESAVENMLTSNDAYLSNDFVPFISISYNQNGISGLAKNGSVYSVDIEKSSSKIEARLSKNGAEFYQLEIERIENQKSKVQIVSVLRNIANPAYDVHISVIKIHHTHDGYPVALLKISFAHHQVIEQVWPGKKQFVNISALKQALSSLPRLQNELNNYFYLLQFKENYDKTGWAILDEFPSSSDQAPGQDSLLISKSQDGVQPLEISGNEAYWCGVGTIGADVVFTLAGSFFYGALCGGIASTS